jgi:hypothetical protein
MAKDRRRLGFADFNAKANGKSFSLFSLLSLSLSLNDRRLCIRHWPFAEAKGFADFNAEANGKYSFNTK